MAERLQFELVSPERALMSAEVDMVTVPGAEGDFGVLIGHAPMISTIRPGVITVDGADGAQKRVFVRGGFAEVTADALTVLAEEAIPVEELDRANLEARLQNAEEDLADADTDEKRHRAAAMISELKELLAAA